MFAKNKVPQSLIDAVKQVTENKIESQPEMLNEAGWDKVPTPTGTKVYGSSYGDSKKARKDQTKSSVDDVKEPKKKDIESQKEETGYFTQKLLEREMTGAESRKKERIVMRMKDKQDYFKKKYGKRWKEVMYATATKQAMGEELNYVEEEEVEQIDEKDNENKRKLKSYAARLGSNFRRDNDKIAHQGLGSAVDKHIGRMVMKGEPHDDIKKYAQSSVQKNPNVSMNLQKIRSKYAKEEVEQLDEIKSLERYSKKMDVDLDHLKAAHKIDMEKTDRDTAHKMMKKSLGSKYNKDHANWSINAFREEVELDESEPAYKDKPDHKPMSDVVNRKKTVKQIMKGSKYFGSGKMKEDVEVEVDKKGDKITTDMLRGRVAGGKINSFKNYKVDLKTSGEEPIPKDIDRGSDTREQQKITTNPGPVDIKLDDKLGHPASQEHFSTEKQITHEEVEVLDESSMLDKYLSSRGINPRFLSKDSKISYSKSNEFKKWLSSHQFEATEVPFDKPYKDTEKVTTDKSGAQHTPMSRAKDLARQAFKKVKQETMMGKISN